MQRSEPEALTAASAASRPQDAATLIILDGALGSPRILFGKRRMDQAFMPGKYVFPGGRVDEADVRMTVAEGLADSEICKLSKQVEGRFGMQRLNGLALAAVRETYEETGLVIGRRTELPHACGPVWTELLSHGFGPWLAPVTFLARAITPPGRPRRYDTRFFCVEAGEIAARIDRRDGELTELHWLTLDEARSFDLPSIQRAVLEDLADRLAAGAIAPSDLPVPFYHMQQGVFRRDLLTADRPRT